MSGYWVRIFEADVELPVAAFGRSAQPDHVAIDPESPQILNAVVHGLHASGFPISIPEKAKPIPGYLAVMKTGERTMHLTVELVSEHGEYNRFRVAASVSLANSAPKISPTSAREVVTNAEDTIRLQSALKAQLVDTVTGVGGRVVVRDLELDNARKKYSFLKL